MTGAVNKGVKAEAFTLATHGCISCFERCELGHGSAASVNSEIPVLFILFFFKNSSQTTARVKDSLHLNYFNSQMSVSVSL